MLQSFKMTVLLNLLLLLALLAIVRAEFFAVPTPFLAKPRQQHQQHRTLDVVVNNNFRGGSAYEKDDDDGEESLDEEWDEEEYDEVKIDDVVLTDGPESDQEETFGQVFDEEEEEEEEVFEDKESDEKEVFESDLEEEEEAEAEPPLTQVLEERIATTTDDESSAFVDRMELADAYDEVDTTADQEDTSLAAFTAATAIGGGASDPEQGGEETAAEEKTDPEITEITDEMKSTLIKELKYKKHEVKSMRPDVAATILEKGLQRPPEGLPQNWYVEGSVSEKKQSLGLRENAVKISVALVALGGIAILGLNADKLQDTVGGLLGAIPAALKSLLPAKKASTPIAVAEAAAKEEVPAVEEEEEEVEDDHPHSVKPYSDHAPSYEEDLDKTWLDKGITKISNGIKAFFRIKI